MDADDGLEDDEPVAGWLHPDDRLWRHPSELAATPWPASSAAFAEPVAPAEPVAATAPTENATLARGGWQSRPWTIALLGGVIGALLATGLMSISNGLTHRSTTVVRPIEQVVTRAANQTPPLVTSNDAVVSIAQRLRPTIVQINVD